MGNTEDQALTPLQMELRDAMGPWGCSLCRLALKAEHACIDSLSYERVLDLKTRSALKASRGLCAHHTRIWQRLQGSALGVAIVYRIALLDLLRDTDPETYDGRTPFWRRGPAQETAERLASDGPCPACEIGKGTVQRFGEVLLADLVNPESQTLLRASGGLCLPHLRTVLGLRGADEVFETLLRVQREAWQGLMAELEEFIRKNDYRFTDEKMTEAEATAWTRVLDVIVGLEDRA
ncbi:MAG: DUF6062 family protein [Anaerolineae bacterium]